MKALRTMSAEEEAEWIVAVVTPMPPAEHVYYLLHSAGMRWVDMETFFGVENVQKWADGHGPTACWWCLNRTAREGN